MQLDMYTWSRWAAEVQTKDENGEEMWTTLSIVGVRQPIWHQQCSETADILELSYTKISGGLQRMAALWVKMLY